MHALKFISKNGMGVYTFPDEQTEFYSNFANLVPITTRLPGLSGGFDFYGDSPAPSEIGNVRIGFTLRSEERSGMEALRDAVRKISEYGLGLLVVQTTWPETESNRFAYARVNSINTNHNNQKNDDLWQRVAIDFQVSAARWYSTGTNIGTPAYYPTWGGGYVWGGISRWGGMNSSGVNSNEIFRELSPSNLGNASTQAAIRIKPEGTAVNPRIRRRVNGAIRDEVSYSGTLNPGDILDIDALSWQVKLNGEDAYTSSFDFLHPEWMRLMPGDNDIEITFDSLSDVCLTTISYYNAWY